MATDRLTIVTTVENSSWSHSRGPLPEWKKLRKALLIHPSRTSSGLYPWPAMLDAVAAEIMCLISSPHQRPVVGAVVVVLVSAVVVSVIVVVVVVAVAVAVVAVVVVVVKVVFVVVVAVIVAVVVATVVIVVVVAVEVVAVVVVEFVVVVKVVGTSLLSIPEISVGVQL